MKKPERAPPPPAFGGRGWIGAVLGIGLIFGLALVYRCSATEDPLALPPGSSGATANSAMAGTDRCRDVIPGQVYRVGPSAGAPAVPEAQAPDLDVDRTADRDDLLSPFAVVVGRATPFAGGYAVGVLGDAEGGGVSFLVTVAADGSTGTTTRLLRSRPDLDPPAVAAIPGSDSVLVAMLEPNATARAIRLARVTGNDVGWGAEIPEDRDESLAIDVAASAKRGVVAWDTMRDAKSSVHVAGFALDSFGDLTSSRVATPPELDADSPRLVASGTGFFLAYLVHGDQVQREKAVDRGSDDPPKPRPTASASAGGKPGKKPAAKPPADDVDESRGGESVASTWIEVMPLDETGAQSSDTVRVTPRGSTVVSFDIAPGPDGTLVVAYRDDDAPTGGGGGVVHLANVRAGGVGASYQSPESLPSDGVPSMLTGWLGIPTLSGADLLARLGADGLPAEPPEKEPSLGRGEPIAASGDRLLLAEPEGRAMRFRVVTCAPMRGSPPGVATGLPGSSKPPGDAGRP